MKSTNSLVVGNTKYLFYIPKHKVIAKVAHSNCWSNGMKLADIKIGKQFYKISNVVEKYFKRGSYEVWHVTVKGENGFIYKGFSRKNLPTIFKKSQNIKALKRSKDVALYSYKNQFDFDFDEPGNYICMTKIPNIDTTKINKKYDEINTEVNNYDTQNDTNTILDLPFNYVTTLNNSINDDISTKLNFQLQNNQSTNENSSNSILGLLIISLLFVAVLVISTLYFVFRKNKKRHICEILWDLTSVRSRLS